MTRLRVGDQVPDLELGHLANYPHDNVRISSFRGKIILLDFWSTGCTGCMAAFPKMEALQHQFRENLQVILVNPWQTDEKIKSTMEQRNYTARYRLSSLPAINGDSTLVTLFPTRTVPHHVWIDQEGKVIAITGGYNATEENVKALINGEKLRMILKPSLSRFDIEAAPVTSYLDQTAFTRSGHSVLRPFYEGEGGTVYGYSAEHIVDSAKGTVRYSYVNIPAMQLFREAFDLRQSLDRKEEIHTTNDQLLWEVTSPDWYLQPAKGIAMDNWARRFRFCYEVTVPLAEVQYLPDIMLRDLNALLQPYLPLRGSFEQRARKSYLLEITDTQKIAGIKTSGESDTDFPSAKNSYTYTYTNTPFRYIFSALKRKFYMGSLGNEPPVHHPALPLIDRTGISGTISMRLPAFDNPVEELPELNNALAIYGLRIRESIEKIDLLVFSDQ
ncbi:hypothetical protein CCY01nite_38640 [Chitinophaga cymbidii]|uniref:Thioredoxin domain-containing protein n=1 Tax=Chitinophaga cymbidii TaxID=1096750 RepID=A0A512RPJ5_9BACT|nr:hypothetical protein CCY01nite_38640 [Chitinophaga cymbidii]